MFKCPKCSKVYKNNGKWLKRHFIEKCHVMHLEPIELVEKQNINLTTIIDRMDYLESIIKNIKFKTKYYDDPIERIREEESRKLIDPDLQKYRQAFSECIIELKKVLEIRKEQVEQNQELDASQLNLVRD